MDFIDKLKVGDTFLEPDGLRGHKIGKVAKITKTQVVAESGERYRIPRGFLIGSGSRYSPWGRQWAKEATPERVAEVMRDRIPTIAGEIRSLATIANLKKLSPSAAVEIRTDLERLLAELKNATK